MKIAIVGAGPAGLACARILSQAGLEVQVFERDASAEARPQGGTLDLHPESGQAAMRRAGLFDQFEKYARYDGQDMILTDRHGNTHVKLLNTDTGRPEIDRMKLRKILLESLPEDMIRWNSNLRSAEPGKLHFEHGTEEGFDLIIGADGAWSKIRSLITPVKPFYSGISGAEINLHDVDTKHPELSEMVGNGSLFAFGDEDGRALLCQRQGNRSIRIYAVGWKPESWATDSAIASRDAPAIRAALLDEFKNFTPRFTRLIENCDDDIIPRTMYMMPPGLRWSTVPGVAIIGDAAHLATPFAGEGVNIALTDAMKLAESIIDNQDDLTKAVREFESWMFPVATKMTMKTWNSLLDRFELGGTRKMGDRINGAVRARLEAGESIPVGGKRLEYLP